MTGTELYTMIDMGGSTNQNAAKERKAAVIEVLQDALDAAWEAGRNAEEEKHHHC